AVVLERELIQSRVLYVQGRGHRVRQIRAATWQRVRKERSAVAVARKMPGRINRVVPDEFNGVSARSVRYDKRRDVGARAVAGIGYGSDRVAYIREINLIVAGKARYRSGEIRRVLERQRACCVRREGNVDRRCGAE